MFDSKKHWCWFKDISIRSTFLLLVYMYWIVFWLGSIYEVQPGHYSQLGILTKNLAKVLLCYLLLNFYISLATLRSFIPAVITTVHIMTWLLIHGTLCANREMQRRPKEIGLKFFKNITEKTDEHVRNLFRGKLAPCAIFCSLFAITRSIMLKILVWLSVFQHLHLFVILWPQLFQLRVVIKERS